MGLHENVKTRTLSVFLSGHGGAEPSGDAAARIGFARWAPVARAAERPASRATVPGDRMSRYVDSRAKRAFDMAGAAVLLLALLPLLAVIAAAIKLDSAGPVFFRQVRKGRGGKGFRVWKFRTMIHSPSGAAFRQAVRNDDRVTQVGAVLRRTSLDELPQLLNVLVGDMSLVGPRPHPVELDDHFRAVLPGIDRRYRSRPGVTGLAQVNGHRGPTPTKEAMRRRLAYDLCYRNRASLLVDLRILLMTVREVVMPRHAF